MSPPCGNVPRSCSNSKGPGPDVIKLFSCSNQLSMKFSLLINMKMPTIVLAKKNIQLLVISDLLVGKIDHGYKFFFMLNSAEHEKKFITMVKDFAVHLQNHWIL